MKAKRIVAMIMSLAIGATATSLLAACGKKDDGKKFVEDTNVYYAVGKDKKSEALNKNNWDFQKIVPELTFERDTTVENENVFKVAFDVYAGGPGGLSFKFVYKTSADEVVTNDVLYTREINLFNMEGVQGSEADAYVNDAEGNTLFTTGDGTDKGNLMLAKGQEGKYEFTLKTFPNDSEKVPQLSCKLVQKIDVPYDMALNGDIDGFWHNGTGYEMDEVSNTSWSLPIEITAADLTRTATGKLAAKGEGEFAAVRVLNRRDNLSYVSDDYTTVKIGENDDGDYVPMEDGEEYMLLPAGNYTIIFDTETKGVTVTLGTNELYFRGTGFGMDWETCPASAKLNPNADKTVWTGLVKVSPEQLELGDVQVKLFDNLKNAWVGVTTVPEDCSINNDGNAILSVAGIYYVKCTISGDDMNQYEVEIERLTYVLVGTFVDEDGTVVNFAIKEGVTPTFEDEIVYDVEDVTTVPGLAWLKDKPGSPICALKAIATNSDGTVNEWIGAYDGTLCENVIFDKADGNLFFQVAGSYKIKVVVYSEIDEEGVVQWQRYEYIVEKAEA